MNFDYSAALHNSNRNVRAQWGNVGHSTTTEGAEKSIERAFADVVMPIMPTIQLILVTCEDEWNEQTYEEGNCGGCGMVKIECEYRWAQLDKIAETVVESTPVADDMADLLEEDEIMIADTREELIIVEDAVYGVAEIIMISEDTEGHNWVTIRDTEGATTYYHADDAAGRWGVDVASEIMAIIDRVHMTNLRKSFNLIAA